MITRWLLYISLLISTACLAVAFGLREFAYGIAGVTALGLLGLISLWRRWRWITPTLFLVFALLNIAVILIQSPPLLSVLSIAFYVLTWDLEHFRHRLERIRSAQVARDIERSHLLHLIPVVVAGSMLSLAALVVHIQLRFAAALILGGLAIIGLTQVVLRLVNRPVRDRKAEERFMR